ncbi:interleukin-21 receptor-like isoform X2 [Pseudophryne corroboree]|uniref:interleukin-21 receptor-like isoform X2 n=1 Tax=Pseudophryne corroboree TaxID=495146 RepID=UPI0030821229
MRSFTVYPCLLLYVHLMQYSIIHTCSSSNEMENLTCFVNYIDYMNCTWYMGSHSGNGPFTLSAEYDDGRKCDLVTISYEENLFSCNITNLYLDETDIFKIMVNDSTSNTLAEINEFIPKCNIRLDPPSGLSYSVNGSIYRIIWTGITELLAETKLLYELQLKKEASSWQEAIPKYIDNSDVSADILSSDFEKGSIYNVRIRRKTENQDHYKSQWSEWSSELKIHTPEKDRSHASISHIIVILGLVMMIFILLYLVLFSNLSTRIKIPFLHDVPTADEFFQDLYRVHNGNFQIYVNDKFN